MPCYFPLQGYRARHVNESGKRSIVFNLKSGFHDLPVTVPCGRCSGCRLERSRQWAIRCVHEASLHDHNCFITLTYAPEHLPADGTLVVSDFQKFMKRFRKYLYQKCLDSLFARFIGRFSKKLLRKYAARKVPKIRYFHCGEYGSKFGRPHYHAIIFGHDFPDKVFFKMSNGVPLYRSDLLESLWPYGHSTVGTATFESAAYVARYIMKKVVGELAFFHYHDIDFSTGEVLSSRKPEYTTMSRRPGIAKGWFDKWHSDVYPRDMVVLRNKQQKPPKFYDSQYELLYPDDMEIVKRKRKLLAKSRKDDNTFDRLDVKRKMKERQLVLLVRNVDKDL